tara:strand:+ start:2955 stop:3875 length:921 start_codon:yes stop_codon:yes gene_type:complete
MKNIFITGGSGFLGKFLIKELSKKNKVYAPTSRQINLLNYKDLNKIKKKYDYIFHLAAWTQAGDFCLRFPGDQWLINQKINTNILNWWKLKNPKAKMVFIGTSCSYPENLKLKEENYMKGEPNEGLYTYAMTKRMLLQGARALEKQYKMKWLCLVPSTLYGPYYHKDGRQMHFIFDLIKKILLGYYKNKKVILWGNGYQKREIIHVKDFVNFTLKIYKKINNEIINIGAGKEFTIREFAAKISKIVSFKFEKINFDKKKYTGTKSKKLEIKKINKLIPTYKKDQIKIEKGLREAINWFKNQLDLID